METNKQDTVTARVRAVHFGRDWGTRHPQECLYLPHIQDASVRAISNYLMFESNHSPDLANQRFFPLKGKIPSFYFLPHN